MKFNRRAKIDTGQIVDRRGSGTQRGGRSPFRMPMRLPRGGGGMFPRGGMYGRRRRGMGGRGGMGCGGIALMAVLALVALFVYRMSSGSDSVVSPSPGTTADLSQCSTGSGKPPLACRIGYDVTSIQDFWAKALPSQANVPYEKAKIVWFTSTTSSGCGQASAGMGPFYCPADKLVYLDPSFFTDMLRGQLGATGGDLAEAYVVAHEYGHHVQDLLGTMSKAQSSATGPTSGSVRLELQADCYAGIWVHFAATVKDGSGQTLISGITRADLADAVNAARAVGDDRIQTRTQGSVDQEQWTHGSSAERVHWFTQGYSSGQLTSCDTFAPGAL